MAVVIFSGQKVNRNVAEVSTGTDHASQKASRKHVDQHTQGIPSTSQQPEATVGMSEQHSHAHGHGHTHEHTHTHGPAHMFQATSEHDQPPDDWKESGVRVIPGGSLDTNTPQTPGMNRAAAVTKARTGAQKLWAGTVKIHANAKTGAHHHGHLESVIYVVKGKARMRWGDKLQFTAEAGPGDFIYVPPYVPHQEINALENEELECVLMRSDDSAVAVNIPDLVPVEDPQTIHWIDPTHDRPL
jgi:uncharacterized RmlC-like cupin family protein